MEILFSFQTSGLEMCCLLRWKDILLFMKAFLPKQTHKRKKQDPSLKYNRNNMTNNKTNMSCLGFYHLQITANTDRKRLHPFTSQQEESTHFNHIFKLKIDFV